jgi:hypothetical protein
MIMSMKALAALHTTHRIGDGPFPNNPELFSITFAHIEKRS